MASLIETQPYNFDMKRAQSAHGLAGIIRLMDGFRLHYAGAISALAISSIARTAGLLLIGWVVDDLLSPQATLIDMTAGLGHILPQTVNTLRPDLPSLLPLAALAFLLLSLVQGGFSYFSGRWAAYTAERIAWRTRNYLFDHLQRLSFSYHDRMQTGELLQRATSDVDAIRRFYVEQGVGIGRILVMFVVSFAGIMMLSTPLALFSILAAPFLIAVSWYMFGKIARKYEELQDQEAKVSATLQEHLSGVRVVRAFARQEHEIERFEGDNWRQFERGKELLMLNALYWPMTDLITSVQLVLGVLLAGYMVIDGTISVGDFVAYVGLVGALIGPLRQIGRLVVQAAQGLGSYKRVMEIVTQEREELHEETAPPVRDVVGDIEFERVSFRYDSATPVLHDVSFRVRPGQVIAILGGTGAGKTSLVGLLPRFYDYTSGVIRLDGVPLEDYPRAFLREIIGLVEQEPFLFSRSIRENITYGVGRDVSDEEVFEAARMAAVHDVIRDFPQGYQTMVGERGVTLSGGQKQRIALARTLLKNPRILILDDATSSVDTETEASIRDALRARGEAVTTFLIAHRVTTLMHADIILVMADGRIVQSGTHEELIAQDGIYRQTYRMQSRIDEELEREMADVE